MNRPELYQRSVSVLIRAFLHEMLAKGDCDTCVAGALCADAIARNAGLHMPPGYWALAFHGADFWTEAPLVVDLRTWEEDWEGCRRLVEATGYAPEELARLEYAFEQAADPYRGLLAVFEVLQAIHEVATSPEKLYENAPTRSGACRRICCRAGPDDERGRGGPGPAGPVARPLNGRVPLLSDQVQVQVYRASEDRAQAPMLHHAVAGIPKGCALFPLDRTQSTGVSW